jgi:hypothetical protein
MPYTGGVGPLYVAGCLEPISKLLVAVDRL